MLAARLNLKGSRERRERGGLVAHGNCHEGACTQKNRVGKMGSRRGAYSNIVLARTLALERDRSGRQQPVQRVIRADSTVDHRRVIIEWLARRHHLEPAMLVNLIQVEAVLGIDAEHPIDEVLEEVAEGALLVYGV